LPRAQHPLHLEGALAGSRRRDPRARRRRVARKSRLDQLPGRSSGVTLDLAQFHDTFFAESFEALDAMEGALLKLSSGDADLELINTIFRVAHSIKGGSATFGFTDVAAFTHTLETLLDQLRAGKRQVDPALVDSLLRSCDLMRAMLAATQ